MIFSQVKVFIRSAFSEWKNFKLPKRSDVIASLYLVVIFSGVCAVIFFALDNVFSRIVRWICNV